MHDDLCQHSVHVQKQLSPKMCTYCVLIRRVEKRERNRQFPDPFSKYETAVEGMPE